MAQKRHFGEGLFEFFEQLEANNNRQWFQANQDRYRSQVEQPMLDFITEVGPQLAKISKHFDADPKRVGGSMFRIYRDTRFSKDKTPYKTWTAARFPHRTRGTAASVPGFYLHLDPDSCTGGGGIHHPDPAGLKRIRDRMVSKPNQWQAVLDAGGELQGGTLKRAPTGYDPAHRYVEDLKRKDLYTMTAFSRRQVTGPTFLDLFLEACEAAKPLVQFSTKALGLPF